MKENTLRVSVPGGAYPICFTRDWSGLPAALEEAGLTGSKLCILTDENVAPLYLKAVRDMALPLFSQVSTFAFIPGENSKNLESIQRFYDFFLTRHCDRKTVVAALGGGVTGDMAGFAAATFMRGLPYIQLPTSLLAQVDSSVGGKTGVDYHGIKNLVGSFYQPRLVYINSATLATLPPREFAAGMAEVIKYGLVFSGGFYRYLEENQDRLKAQDPETIEKVLRDCCAFKADVVARDEKESGEREVLNFGHTVGHAVESLLGFALLHGECVGLGMLCAMALSGLPTDPLRKLLEAFGLPVKAFGLSKDEIYSQMFRDKKVIGDRLRFVLLSEIGKAYRTDTVTKEAVWEALGEIL